MTGDDTPASAHTADWQTDDDTHPENTRHSVSMERKVAREFRHKVGFETATVWLKICEDCLVIIISYYRSKVRFLSLLRNGEGARFFIFTLLNIT